VGALTNLLGTMLFASVLLACALAELSPEYGAPRVRSGSLDVAKATMPDVGHRSPLLQLSTGSLRSSLKAVEGGTLALALGLRGGEDEGAEAVADAADEIVAAVGLRGGETEEAAEEEDRAAQEARVAEEEDRVAEEARLEEAARQEEAARRSEEARAERARAERVAAAAKAATQRAEEARLEAARKRKRMLLTAAAATAALATGGSVTLGKVLQKEPEAEEEWEEAAAAASKNPQDLWLDRQIDKLVALLKRKLGAA